jgi:hypothetical protein
LKDDILAIFLLKHPPFFRVYFPGKEIHQKKNFLGNNENFFFTIPYFLQNNFLAFTLVEMGVSFSKCGLCYFKICFYCDTLQGPIGLRPGYSQKNGPSASGLRGPLSALGLLPCTKYYEFQKVLKEQKQGSHQKKKLLPG